MSRPVRLAPGRVSRHVAALALSLATALLVVNALAGCMSARRGEPFAQPVALTDAVQVRGEQVFARHCAQCHPGGEAGLGPAINDRPLPKGAIAAQIRLGVGAMPAFPEDVISSDDVDAVTEYLLALRRSPRPE